MPLSLPAFSGLASPRPGGSWPRVAVVIAFAALALSAACNNGSGDQVTAPMSVGMTSSIAPYYSDGEITLYQASIPVALPVRKPSGSQGSAPKGTPYPHAPFLTVDDESVEVHWVLTNLDSVPRNVWLLIDPWNEFVRWKPGVTVVSDEETLPNEGYDQEFVLPPKSKTEGTITSDDTKEIAIKLASVENFLASPQGMPQTGDDGGGAAGDDVDDSTDNSLDPTTVCNNIFDYQNRSNSVPPDPFFTPWIPPVVAGLTGFDLGVRTELDADSDNTTEGDAGAAANVAVEITMDVIDLNGDKFVPQGSSDPTMGPPSKTLSPPAARF